MQFYTFNGRRLGISSMAEMARDLMPGDGKYRQVMQEALDTIGPWEGKGGVIKTCQFPKISCAPTAQTVKRGTKIVWAIHKAHRFPNPPLSPFVVYPRQIVTASREARQSITLELRGPYKKPVLIRALHGLPTPPLPGANMATRWEGSEGERVQFWLTHAYLYWEPLIVPGTLTEQPPSWYTRP